MLSLSKTNKKEEHDVLLAIYMGDGNWSRCGSVGPRL